MFFVSQQLQYIQSIECFFSSICGCSMHSGTWPLCELDKVGVAGSSPTGSNRVRIRGNGKCSVYLSSSGRALPRPVCLDSSHCLAVELRLSSYLAPHPLVVTPHPAPLPPYPAGTLYAFNVALAPVSGRHGSCGCRLHPGWLIAGMPSCRRLLPPQLQWTA